MKSKISSHLWETDLWATAEKTRSSEVQLSHIRDEREKKTWSTECEGQIPFLRTEPQINILTFAAFLKRGNYPCTTDVLQLSLAGLDFATFSGRPPAGCSFMTHEVTPKPNVTLPSFPLNKFMQEEKLLKQSRNRSAGPQITFVIFNYFIIGVKLFFLTF